MVLPHRELAWTTACRGPPRGNQRRHGVEVRLAVFLSPLHVRHSDARGAEACDQAARGREAVVKVTADAARRSIAENGDVAGRVLERIRADGPLSALDFERERGTTTDWFGVAANAVRAVLEAYAVTGVLGLARRDGNRRYYDLLERLLPADVLARKVPLEEQMRYKLLSRYRAHGLLGAGGAGDVLGEIGRASCRKECRYWW